MIRWQWGKPLIDGFTNQPQKGFKEITPDAGVPTRSVTFTDISDIANCSFILTKEQYRDFLYWYRVTIRQGCIPFEFYDCRYGIDRVARIVGEVPQQNTESKYFRLDLIIAFDSGMASIGFNLAVNDDILIVNENSGLVVGKNSSI